MDAKLADWVQYSERDHSKQPVIRVERNGRFKACLITGLDEAGPHGLMLSQGSICRSSSVMPTSAPSALGMVDGR